MMSAPPPGPDVTLAGLLAAARASRDAGRPAEAEAAYRRVLASRPGHAEALGTLGVLAFQAGRLAEAAEWFGRAAAAAPGDAGALGNQGLALAGLGRHDAAMACYDRALALRPDYPEALSNRGETLRALGRPEAALASLDRALALRPDDPAALSNRGIVLMELGRLEEALASHDRAIQRRPDLPQPHLNRGNVLRRLGRVVEALASCDAALALHPGWPEAHANRGISLRLLGRHAEALASLDRALAPQPTPLLAPQLAAMHVARGCVLYDLNQAEAALAALDHAIALQPALAEAHWERGVALTLLDRLDEALASFDRAAALAPGQADPWANRAAALSGLGRNAEALAALDRALALRPADPTAEFNKSLILLQSGRYAEAWPLYEARWRVPETRARMPDFAQPLWRGEPLAGRTLLVHAEQGHGDTIQFCRYVPMLAARAAAEGGRVVFQVQPALPPLLAGLAEGVEVIAQGAPAPRHDLHCPLLSLPRWFATTLETIPPPAPPRADPARMARWAPRLDGLARPRVGLVWSGNARRRGAARGHIPLATLLPLLRSGAGFVALRKEVAEGEAADLARAPALRDLGRMFDDFADTAAVIAQLDLVISVDTAVAHLAASLGRPTWLMLPAAAEWRWLLDRADSPWYPTVRLFRQPAPGDWGGVVEQMRAALARLGQAERAAAT